MSEAIGLVLFSHGSLLCGAGSVLKRHAESLRVRGTYVAVEPGYLNYCKPPVEEAISACVDAGAEKVVIVPYFLISGKFVTEDLPQRLQTAMAQFPHTAFKVGRAIEDCGVMTEAVEKLLPGARDPAAWQQEALAQSRLQCELRTNCPLYGSPACRATGASA